MASSKKSVDQIVKEAVLRVVEETGGIAWKQEHTAKAVALVVGDRLAAEEIQAIAMLANTSAIRQALEKAGKIVAKSKGMFA